MLSSFGRYGLLSQKVNRGVQARGIEVDQAEAARLLKGQYKGDDAKLLAEILEHGEVNAASDRVTH